MESTADIAIHAHSSAQLLPAQIKHETSFSKQYLSQVHDKIYTHFPCIFPQSLHRSRHRIAQSSQVRSSGHFGKQVIDLEGHGTCTIGYQKFIDIQCMDLVMDPFVFNLGPTACSFDLLRSYIDYPDSKGSSPPWLPYLLTLLIHQSLWFSYLFVLQAYVTSGFTARVLPTLRAYLSPPVPNQTYSSETSLIYLPHIHGSDLPGGGSSMENYFISTSLDSIQSSSTPPRLLGTFSKKGRMCTLIGFLVPC